MRFGAFSFEQNIISNDLGPNVGIATVTCNIKILVTENKI